MNLGNIDYHQSVAEFHPDLVLKFAHLEDLEDVDLFNISGVDGVKKSEQWKVGVYIDAVISYKKSLSGKRKTGDSLPRYSRRGGIQHHIFMAIPADN